MFRAYPQHLCVALRAAFLLTWHAAIVGHNRVAFWADALPTASHSVLAIPFGHFVSPERVRYLQEQLHCHSIADSDI